VPRYYAALDFEALWREFVPAPEYEETTFRLGRDALRALQEERFARQMARAWQIPFYRRHWGGAGIEPGDIREFAPGDAIRQVNWRASLRLGKLYVTQHHREHNADVVLMLDTLAQAHFVAGDLGKAIETQEKAVKLKPDDKRLKEHLDTFKKERDG